MMVPQNNFEELLETLNRFESQKFGDFVVSRTKSGRIQVNAYVSCNKYENYLKESNKNIKNELEKAILEFNRIVNNSIEFKQFALKCGMDYFLVIDMGNGGATICSVKDGIYKQNV